MASLLPKANAVLKLYLTSLQPWGSSQWATVCVKVPFLSDNCTLRFHSPYLVSALLLAFMLWQKMNAKMSVWIFAPFCLLSTKNALLQHNNIQNTNIKIISSWGFSSILRLSHFCCQGTHSLIHGERDFNMRWLWLLQHITKFVPVVRRSIENYCFAVNWIPKSGFACAAGAHLGSGWVVHTLHDQVNALHLL